MQTLSEARIRKDAMTCSAVSMRPGQSVVPTVIAADAELMPDADAMTAKR